jgi:adenosylcobinamide kinase / adenosylcobinamide-phosphate guanylyltransferase
MRIVWIGGSAMTPRLTLVLGGARSGKSRYAEALVEALAPPWVYVATAQPFDDEMRERIAAHRARRSAEWRTLDAPLDVASAIRSAHAHAPVLVDCLTLWLTNLALGAQDARAAVEDLRAASRDRSGPVVLVSNEVGLGIVPENALARRFRDLAGEMHQSIAIDAERVVFMVAGLPVIVE